jgi:putative selenium metabolism hydrolase
LSGEEGRVAQLILEKMEQLNYDETWTDQVGNVIGLLRGDRDMASVCFTVHMDHVDPGNEYEWEYPPYSGTIANGFVHGRGASDAKGAIATHVYIPELLARSKMKHGDIYVVEVVHEEKGGLGSMYLDEKAKNAIDYAILGEPSSNNLMIGHKGRIELIITFKGRSCHASMPELGVNPLDEMARFLLKFRNLEMANDAIEKSTAAPTICRTDTQSSNIIPGICELTVDWRTIPNESETQVLDKIRGLLSENAEAHVSEYKLKTYTGLTFPMKRSRPPYSIDKNHPLVRETASAIRSTLGRDVDISRRPFATDCGCFKEAGIPIIGFSPCEEKYAHTNRDRVSLRLISEAFKCYPAIIYNLSKLKTRKK